ncbi:hypothetical protein ACWDOP_31210 [Nocardia sp. NPDC003693]
MTFENNMARRMRGVRGALQKYQGRVSGDRRLEARGRRGQVRSDLTTAFYKLRAALRR